MAGARGILIGVSISWSLERVSGGLYQGGTELQSCEDLQIVQDHDKFR